MEQPKKFRAYGRKLLQLIFVLLGGSLGATYFPSLWQAFDITNEWLTSQVTSILLGAIILFFISFFVTDPILAGIRRLEKLVSQLSVSYLLFGMIGALIGLLVAWLVGLPFTNFTNSSNYASFTNRLKYYLWVPWLLCRNDAS